MVGIQAPDRMIFSVALQLPDGVTNTFLGCVPDPMVAHRQTGGGTCSKSAPGQRQNVSLESKVWIGQGIVGGPPS